MKTSILSLCIIALFLHACNTQVDSPQVVEETIEEEEPTRLLRHVVLFNFNDDATDDKVQEIETAFAGLPQKIKEIHSFEWGTNNSPEGLDKGLTHCFFVTFLSEKDREIYLPHPAHKEFVDLVGPFVEDVTVVDYWTE